MAKIEEIQKKEQELKQECAQKLNEILTEYGYDLRTFVDLVPAVKPGAPEKEGEKVQEQPQEKAQEKPQEK